MRFSSLFRHREANRSAPLTTVGAPITEEAVPLSDGSGPEEVEMKSSKKKEKKTQPEENKVYSRLKKSHTEYHLVSKTVVQNTTKITFSLPEKTSYTLL